MLSRNALAVIVATALTAAVAGAQQPAKPATTRSTAPTAQAPAQAKKSAKTASAAALPINADSAKKIVTSNAAGATVTSARLHRSAGRSYYSVAYKMKGEKKAMHATVDANTGAFANVAAPAKSAKKP